CREDLKRVEELWVYKYANLKELIGMRSDQPLSLAYDYQLMEQKVLLDTTAKVDHQDRFEYRQLLTLKKLQEINTQYNKWSYLPNISASYNYAWDFRHDQFSQLYRQH